MKFLKVWLCTLMLASMIPVAPTPASADVGLENWGTGTGEIILFNRAFLASWTVTSSFAIDKCLTIYLTNGMSVATTCNETNGRQSLTWGRDVVITRILVGVGFVQGSPTASALSCDFALSLNEGVGQFTGVVEIPGTGETYASGTAYGVTGNWPVTAGTRVAIQVRDGDTCSATCNCGNGQMSGNIEIWGFFTE